MSKPTRHNSIDALRERYQRTRLQHSNSEPIVPTTVYEEEEEEDEQEDQEAEEEEGEEDDYSLYSDSSSIPDENINFDLVYALHTFVATVDGQASVVKGDAMTLLDDSNSYWWLIRALKASEVGYIPAENIETPFERLARLNKHRNVEVTSLDHLQHYTSASATTEKKHKKVQLSKELDCQLQIILTDQDDESLYEETFEKWYEEMPAYHYHIEESEEESSDQDSVVEANQGNKYTPLMNPQFNKPINIQNKPVVKPVITAPAPPPHELVVKPPVEEPKPVTASSPPAVKKVTGLKRLLSIGSNSSSNSNKTSTPAPVPVQQSGEEYHVLRIFSGNINVGAMFNTVAVTPDMNADQLLKLALQKFHIPLLQQQQPSGIEYYLTVKSMDGDEITLEPTDKPLAIFESLSDHLTTPMPSLTYIKRLSLEQPTIQVTRVGVSKARQRAQARFGEDSVIRFSLHKRIKRTIDGQQQQIYIKLCHYTQNNKLPAAATSPDPKINTLGLIRKSSLMRVDQQVQQQQQQLKQSKNQERIDKLVAVSTTTFISDLVEMALDKFHIINEDKSSYYMALSFHGKEIPLLDTSKTISDILAELIPKGVAEKLFVLRKNVATEQEVSNRFVRLFNTKQPQEQQEHDTSSSAGNVLKRLDQAIQSLEHDKRQLDKRMIPVRSNSLGAMSTRPKIAPMHAPATPPTRGSSLVISGDVFDTSNHTSLSNMDDLELELKRIATSSH